MVMSFSGGTDQMVADFGADLSFPVLSDTTGEIMERWDKDGAVPSQSLLAPGLSLLQVDEILDDAGGIRSASGRIRMHGPWTSTTGNATSPPLWGAYRHQKVGSNLVAWTPSAVA